MRSAFHRFASACVVVVTVVGCASLAGLDDLAVTGAAGTASGGAAGIVGDGGIVDSSPSSEAGLAGHGGTGGKAGAGGSAGTAGKGGAAGAGGEGGGGQTGSGGVSGGGVGGDAGSGGVSAGGQAGSGGEEAGGSAGTSGSAGIAGSAGTGGSSGAGGVCGPGFVCLAGVDPGTWANAGDINVGACSSSSSPSVLFSENDVLTAQNSACNWSCGFDGQGHCLSTVSCSTSSGCTGTSIDVLSGVCTPIGNGAALFCVASPPTPTAACNLSSVTLTPSLAPSVHACFEATTPCAGGACVWNEYSCLATGDPTASCPLGYSAMDFYRSVQDTRSCSKAACVGSCGGSKAITVYSSDDCSAQHGAFSSDGLCSYVGPLSAITLDADAECGPSQGSGGAEGSVYGVEPLRVCCKP